MPFPGVSRTLQITLNEACGASLVASAIAMIENEAAGAAASLAAIVALAGKTIARCGRSVSQSTVSVSVVAPEKHAGALLGLIAIAFFSSP